METNPSQTNSDVSPEKPATSASLSDEQRLLAQLRRASELISANQLALAEEELARSHQTAPRDLRVLKLLALVRFKLGRLAEAQQVYRAACDVAPDDPTVRLNLGLIALKLETFAEAAQELEATVRLQPDDRRAWSYLGYAYARSSAPAQAATAFRRAGQHELAAEMERAASPVSPEASAVVEGPTLAESRGAPSVATPRPTTSTAATPMPVLLPDDAAMPSKAPTASLAHFATERLLALPGGAEPVMALGKGILRFSAGSEVHVRHACLLAALGGQGLSLARRRTRGRLSADALEHDDDRFFRVEGGADLLLCSDDPTRHLFALSLDRDVLYLDASRVAAWGDDVVWESGAIPGSDKPMLQFRGIGRVVLAAAPEEIVAVALAEGERMAVPTVRLVGWLGRVVVQGQATGPDAVTLPGLHHVTCEGEGVLLLAKHAQHP